MSVEGGEIRRERVVQGGGQNADLVWCESKLIRIESEIFDAGSANVALVQLDLQTTIDHEVLGTANSIVINGKQATLISAVDWQTPTMIPAIWQPQRLPRGSGTLLLNCLAVLAQRASVTQLRYCGAYPTAALYQTLQASFVASSTLEEFCLHAWQTAKTGRAQLSTTVFAPRPFALAELAPEIVARIRDDELVALRLHGVWFSDSDETRRLLRDDWNYRAELWLAEQCWQTAATVDERRNVDWSRDEPLLAPDVQRMIGATLPPALLAAIGGLLAPDPELEELYCAVAQSLTVRWQRVHWDRAAQVGAEIHLHPALWQLASPRGHAAAIASIATALQPLLEREVIARWAVGEKSR